MLFKTSFWNTTLDFKPYLIIKCITRINVMENVFKIMLLVKMQDNGVDKEIRS